MIQIKRNAVEGNRSVTRTKEIYKTLKERIVFLDYEPGQQLREQVLRDEFGIGRTPLRETLIRLQCEGLVTVVPNSGTYVATVGFQQLRDVFEIRKDLANLAGRLSALRATKEEIDKMRNLLKKMKDEHNSKRLMKLDSQFHDLFNQATQNKVLANFMRQLRNQAVRIWVFPRDKSFFHCFQKDFESLLDAVEMKDEKSSAKILQSHLQHFIDQVKEQL